MTHEEIVRRYLFTLAFFEEDINRIFEIIKQSEPAMENRWKDQDVIGNPMRNALYFRADYAAYKWLSENGKQHPARAYLESKFKHEEE